MSGNIITPEVFNSVDLRVGTVRSARVFEKARNPSYILEVDFGPEVGVLRSSAQITDHYLPEDLIGKQVIGITNLPPKQIANMMSECLITGFHDKEGAVVLAVPDKPAINGSKLC